MNKKRKQSQLLESRSPWSFDRTKDGKAYFSRFKKKKDRVCRVLFPKAAQLDEELKEGETEYKSRLEDADGGKSGH